MMWKREKKCARSTKQSSHKNKNKACYGFPCLVPQYMQLQKLIASQDTLTLPSHLIYQLFEITNSGLLLLCTRKYIKYLDAVQMKLLTSWVSWTVHPIKTDSCVVPQSYFSKQLSISLLMTDTSSELLSVLISSSAPLSVFFNTFLRTGLLKLVSLPPPPQLSDLLEVWWWQIPCAIHDTSVHSNPAGLKSYSYFYNSQIRDRQSQFSCMKMTWTPTHCNNQVSFP